MLELLARVAARECKGKREIQSEASARRGRLVREERGAKRRTHENTSVDRVGDASTGKEGHRRTRDRFKEGQSGGTRSTGRQATTRMQALVVPVPPRGRLCGFHWIVPRSARSAGFMLDYAPPLVQSRSGATDCWAHGAGACVFPKWTALRSNGSAGLSRALPRKCGELLDQALAFGCVRGLPAPFQRHS